ncbi:MAG: hypothetical protein L0Y58_09795 [Verrucomicrobia subdivision 3 bacterium]|nr:hypothetical protein [Limisphaerales bacterium]
MKIVGLLGGIFGAVILLSGCASTNGDRDAPRWVVVSTNEPVSSDSLERTGEPGETLRTSAGASSVLLAPEAQDARQEIENAGLPPVLKKKMLDGEVLSLADIEDLGRYKVSEATMLKYLRATAAIYILRTDDINRLQQAGVSKSVIDYLLATVNERPPKVVRRYYHRYYYDPWYYPYYHYPFYHHYHYYHYGHHHHGGLRVYRPR